MWHSIKEIGVNYESLSTIRNDEIKFNANDFFNFALNNMKPYSIIENGDDLLVSTWFCETLITNYKNLIK